MIVLFLAFEQHQYRFPQWLHQFTFTLTRTSVPFALHLHQHLLFVIFWWWPFRPQWGNIPLWFYLHFSNDYWCWASFHVPVGHLCAFFGKVSIEAYTQFLSACLFFWMFICMSHLSVIICKCFLPLSMLSFHFVHGSLCCAKAFRFNLVSCVCFWFCFLCLRRQIQDNTLYVKEHSTLFSSRFVMVSSLIVRSLILFEGCVCVCVCVCVYICCWNTF